MISHKHKFIFVHIPKTGGTSIERSLEHNRRWERHSKKHSTIIEYEKQLGFNITSYLKFSVIRNPWDRLVSYWKYRQNKPWAHIDGKLNDFPKWLRFIASLNLSNLEGKTAKCNISDFRMGLDTQYNSLKNSTGDIQVELIKFENLQKDFNIVCDKIGIPHRQLPHKNKTKHKHYTKYYDNETREIVAELAARDIEYFGYEFGE